MAVRVRKENATQEDIATEIGNNDFAIAHAIEMQDASENVAIAHAVDMKTEFV